MAEPAHKTSSGREALLESAAILFSARGYESVSTREIADRAGVNIALIQYHFGSKANLFIEVVEQLTQNSKNLLESFCPLPDSLPPLKAAVEFCRFVSAFLTHILDENNSSCCKLVFREMFSERSLNPEFFDAVLQFILEKHAGPIRTRLQTLIGFICPDLSAEEREMAVHSVIGQCTFYGSNRPILEKLSQLSLTRETAQNQLAPFVSSFTLRGLGCSDEFIRMTLAEVF